MAAPPAPRSLRRDRFRRLFGLEPKADVDHELAFHLEMRTRELVARGETPERARELTLRRFGDYAASRRACIAIDTRRRRRLVRGEQRMEIRQDIGYALRLLRRTPGFTVAAILTLALGIGATTAIFSVVHGVLLTSLPFRHAERLYHLQMRYPDGTEYAHTSAPDFMSVRADARAFERVEAFTTRPVTLLGAGDPREIDVASVSDGLFDLLALPVALGRAFAPGENQPGRGALLVLSHGFWLRDLGGARDALGRTLVVNGRPCLVIGVLGAGAGLTEPADAYMPLEYNDTFSATTAQNRRGEFLTVLGLAKPGVTPAQATDEVRRLGAQLQQTFPDTNAGLTFSAAPLHETIVGDVREPLLVLFGAVAFVLLVACANVANLLLARASTRQGEMAVRAALGASRARLLRQLVTESTVLGAIGGVLGLALAFGLTRALVAARPADIPRLDEVGVDATVLAFTLGLVLLTSLLVAVLPALQATGVRLTRALSAGGRSQGRGSGGQRLRAALVVAEITLAVVLLMGAGLFVRSFIERTRVDPGFTAAGAMSFRVSMQGEAYGERTAIVQRVADIEARVRALPGVTAAGATTSLPVSGRGSLVGFGVEGAPPPPPDVNAEIGLASVTPGYFEAIGARLRRGRWLSARDSAEAPRVAVANEAAVRFWLPDRDPIGRHVLVNDTRYEIVGVVADIQQRGAGERVLPQLYAPYAQRSTRSVRIVVRGAGDPSALGPSIRGAIRAIDANLPIEGFAPLDRLIASSVARPRFYTALLALFAGVGLVLAATGIFGVMSYTVAERTREISIRLALGAQRSDVRRLVAGRVALLTGAGLAAGVAGAIGFGRAIETQLFGVGRLDPLTLAGVILVLGSSAVAASVLPLRRATRLDPAQSLREG